ncbi:uncharacterized protein LOC120068817 [Benincasa hispida]|uniref:uncharacterized protein LOC120068817 n=1 Tax=Benincasa hispida TaxID=102211 RepID=UPI001901CCB7|nr:uncharacterized protein LOC120068817 [Benincasa hispida]
MKIRQKNAHDRPLERNPLTASIKSLPMLMLYFLLMFFSMICLFYSPKFLYYSSFYCRSRGSSSSSMKIDDSVLDPAPESLLPKPREETNISHVIFGIAASAKLWNHRKNYIKLWWRSNEMRGIVWLDEAVESAGDDDFLPTVMISSDTSEFLYENPEGHRSAIRISRIVSETLRLGLFARAEVRWIVMGDDDTFFAVDNLVKVLRKYDDNQFYYIGSSSESHLQNMHFSYNMAYGGGGFAISYPLAKELEKMQDNCLQRYPKLYGSDDRIQACMAELGVPLTREPGFHQCDVYGNLFGLLTAHPLAPLVSLHHLDIVDPIFPEMGRFEALQKLGPPMNLDSAGLMQQSICYHKSGLWTVSIAWGYAVQIFLTKLFPRDVQLPATTFLNWYPNAGTSAHAFNTRSISLDACQTPFVYYLHNITFNASTNQTVSRYTHYRIPEPECKWKMSDHAMIEIVDVLRKPDPLLWDKAPKKEAMLV